MREFIKVLCVVFLLFGVPTAAITWLDDRPSETVWLMRWSSSAVSVLALLLFLKLHFKQDKTPDFLRQCAGEYFNRGGFCFAINTAVESEVLYFRAWFQNQYENPCQGRIALRPGRGFFMNRPDIESVIFDVECAGGAFGVASVPIPLQKELQGKQQTFEVGAAVEYKQGRGERLRYRDGLILRYDTEFKNAFGTAIKTLGALSGSIVLTRPAKVKLSLPIGVSEHLPGDILPEVQTLWTLGADEELQFP